MHALREGDFFQQSYAPLPDTQKMLDQQTNTCDTDPATQPNKNRFPATFNQPYDIRIESYSRHRHNNKELAQGFQRGKNMVRYPKRRTDCRNDRS